MVLHDKKYRNFASKYIQKLLIESVGRLCFMRVGGHGCHNSHFHGNSDFSGVFEQFVLWKESLVKNKKLQKACSSYSKKAENSLIITDAHRIRLHSLWYD